MSLTKYELFFAILFIFALLYLVLFWFRRGKNFTWLMLKGGLLFSLIIIAYSILTYGQSAIHSDTAIATTLSISQLKHGSLFPASWNYANGDIWVFTMNTLTPLFRVFIRTESLARMLGSLGTVLISMFGFVFLSRSVFSDSSYLVTIPFLYLFMCSSVACAPTLTGNLTAHGTSDVLLYQCTYAIQVSLIGYVPVLISSISSEENGKRRYFYSAILFVLFFLLCISGARMVGEQVLPILGTTVIFFYLEYCNNPSDLRPIVFKSIPVLGITFFSAILGLIVYRWLCTWHNVNKFVSSKIYVESTNKVIDNIHKVVASLIRSFGYDPGVKAFSLYGIRNALAMLFCVLLCLIIPILQFRRYNEEDESVRFFLIYGLVHNVMVFFYTASFGNLTEIRYLISSVVVCVCISFRYICKYWMCPEGMRDKLIPLFFSFVTILGMICMLEQCKGWSEIVSRQRALNDTILAHDVSKGYATYWNAYNNEIYSNHSITYGGVRITENGIKKYLWLVDGDIFEPEEGERSFLLLSQDEDAIVKNYMRAEFGNPVEEFAVGDNMQVYVFDHDIGGELLNP